MVERKGSAKSAKGEGKESVMASTARRIPLTQTEKKAQQRPGRM